MYKNADDLSSIEMYHNIASKIVINVQNDEPGTPTHTHSFLELCMVMSGEIYNTINGKTVLMKKNDFFLVDFGTSHKLTKLGGGGEKMGNVPCSLINVLFQPSAVDNTLRDNATIAEVLASKNIGLVGKVHGGKPANTVYHDDSGVIEQLLLDMKKEFGYMLFGYEKKLRCDLISILIHIARYLTPEDMETEISSTSDKIISYIEQHYNEDLTLEKMGEIFHIHPTYLCSKFKKETGYSFVQYHQKTRITNACHLLALTNMRISEISHAVGYDDVKYFEKIFRKHTLTSPREFRKSEKIVLTKNKWEENKHMLNING